MANRRRLEHEFGEKESRQSRERQAQHRSDIKDRKRKEQCKCVKARWLCNSASSIRAGLTADGKGFKEPVPAELSDREWRADPIDGLRPFRHVRESWTPA